MSNSDQLRREHAIIERVLDGADLVAQRLRRGEMVPALLTSALLEFFTAFVCGCHRAKEARGVFASVPGLRALFEADHAAARRRLDALRCAPADPDVLEDYLAFERVLLHREAASLIPQVEQLTAAEAGRVAEAFAQVDELLGENGRAALVGLASAIARSAHAESAAYSGRWPDAICAREVMRVRTGEVAPGMSLAQAVQAMDALGVREVPVVSDGRLVGILTRWDLLPYHGQLEWTPVRTAMTRDPSTIAPEATVRDAARLLVRHCWNSLPVVVDGAVVVGMISRGDVLRVLSGEDRAEAEGVADSGS